MLVDLCRYYDCLAQRQNSPIVKDGFSEVNIRLNLVLAKNGELREILPYVVNDGKKDNPRKEIFPLREEKTTVYANIIDHRPRYIFGLEFKNDSLKVDKTSLKSFECNKQKNLEFLNDINSDIVVSYKNFLMNWNPESEIENSILLSIGKQLEKSNFVISFEDDPTKTLNNDSEVVEKWERMFSNSKPNKDDVFGQCAITGKIEKIARIHSNLKGIKGGQASGVNLVSFNETAFESYNKEQSYNSMIGETAMKKYTTAFNYLAGSKNHKQIIGDMTLLYWVEIVESEDNYLDIFNLGIFGEENTSAKELEIQTKDNELSSIMYSFSRGELAELEKFNIDSNVKFFILGVVPNNSRLSVKIFEKSNFGSILKNIEKHINDMKLNENDKSVSLKLIKDALQSINSKEETSPNLMSDILKSILLGIPYPKLMLSILIRRLKTENLKKDDKKEEFSKQEFLIKTRIRLIKAYLTRVNYLKGDFNMYDNDNVAFNLGKLFAILETIQKKASGGDLNATIKDKYFASACGTPSVVFPTLIKLAQAHLKKIGSKDAKDAEYYEDKIGYTLSKIKEGFPKQLKLEEQGMFEIGYYSQRYLEKSNKNDAKNAENTNENAENE